MRAFTLTVDGEDILSVAPLGQQLVLCAHGEGGPVVIGTLLDERSLDRLRAALAKLAVVAEEDTP